MSLHCIAGCICCIIGDTIVDSQSGRKPPLGLVSVKNFTNKKLFPFHGTFWQRMRLRNKGNPHRALFQPIKTKKERAL